MYIDGVTGTTAIPIGGKLHEPVVNADEGFTLKAFTL